MRNKTIREAVVGAILVTFIFTAAPATARGASPSPRPVRASGSVLAVLADWLSAWAGAAFERTERPAGERGQTKAGSSPIPPAPSPAENSNVSADRGAAIDPVGLN